MDVLEKCIASIIWVERTNELGTILAGTFHPDDGGQELSTLMMEGIHSSKTSFLMTATQRHITEDNIFQTGSCFRLHVKVTVINYTLSFHASNASNCAYMQE
jgi:hypothetical protein